VLLAGLAAVVGHNWMVWLKFSGGKGMAAILGALAVALPAYGYWQAFLIFLGIVVVPLVVTRNLALSMGTGLLFLPLVVWLFTRSVLAMVMALILGLTVLVKFYPTARQDWARARSAKEFIFSRRGDGRELVSVPFGRMQRSEQIEYPAAFFENCSVVVCFLEKLSDGEGAVAADHNKPVLL
jgi:hypothetical protein